MRARKPESFLGGGGGECDSRRHSTTGFRENVMVAGTSYQIFLSLIVLWPGKGKTFSYKNNLTNFSGET